MRKKRLPDTNIALAMLALFVVFSFGNADVSCAADHKVIKWQVQTLNAPGESAFKRYEAMMDDLKKRTGGRLEVTLYAAGALVPSKEIFQAVKRGMIPAGQTYPGYIRSDVPVCNIACGLPLNFKAVWEAQYFYDILGFDKMMDEGLAKHNLFQAPTKVYPTMIVTKKPINKIEDFKGMKLRSSGLLQNYFTSIGAAASYIPGSELYAALATGVVEGAHWGGYTGAFDQGLYEIAKYQFPVPLNVSSTEIWIINKKAIAKLPKDIQEMLPGFFKEYFPRMTTQYRWIEAECKARITGELGVKHLPFPDEDYKKMQEMAQPIWDEAAKKSQECAKAVKMLRDFHKSLYR